MQPSETCNPQNRATLRVATLTWSNASVQTFACFVLLCRFSTCNKPLHNGWCGRAHTCTHTHACTHTHRHTHTNTHTHTDTDTHRHTHTHSNTIPTLTCTNALKAVRVRDHNAASCGDTTPDMPRWHSRSLYSSAFDMRTYTQMFANAYSNFKLIQAQTDYT